MTIRIKLVGCSTYTYGPKGEKFEKGYEYDLDDSKARVLLSSSDDKGRAFFQRVETPAPLTEDTIIEETTGDGVGGVRIVRRKGGKVRNPKVRTSGDTAPLRDDGKDDEGLSEEDLDDEGIEI